jgi:hypothetical protein
LFKYLTLLGFFYFSITNFCYCNNHPVTFHCFP